MASRHSRLRTAIVAAVVFLVAYGIIAYIALPFAWTHYEHQKGLAGHPMVTRTAQGIPGDPINVGLVGAKADVLCAMHAAAWYPADPITLRSSVVLFWTDPIAMRRSAVCFTMADVRILRSKSRTARAPIVVSTSVSGRC